MKTKLLLMLLAIALVVGIAQANMLKNPGFEDGAFETNYSPDNWENYYTAFGQAHTWLNNAGLAHSGSKYIKMYNWLIKAPSYVTSAFLGQEVLGVKEGRDYTFSVWAKNGVEGQVNLAQLYVDWLDSAGVGNPSPDVVAIASDSVNIVVTDANWVEIDFGALTAPKGAVAAYVFLGAPLANDLRAIFYDDVSMLGADPNITAPPHMISWDGETLSLTGTTSLDGYSTITWSAEPDYGAVITDGDTLTPTVEVDCIIPSGPATIANHSFENGLDNWEILNGDGHDTWIGTDVDANDVLTIFITPTDGLMCAYLDGVTDGAGTLSQVLAHNLVAANTTYTLTVDVGNDGYYEENVAYRVQLRAAGGGVLKQDNDGHALDTYGEWATSTVTYESGDTPTYSGEPLEIRLIAKAGTAEMNFDNVHLTADPAFPAHVPDVLTIKLTLDIDGKYDTMRIDTYPDACAAWLAAGLRETTDLVGDECITNLPDLAEMVKTWTDNNALTEPKAKEQQAQAGVGQIPIVNAGFEAPHPSVTYVGDYTYTRPVPGWGYLSGQPDDYIGLWWINSDPSDIYGYGYGGSAPEGNNVAMNYNDTDYDADVGFAQVLAETFTANTTYTLTVEVGHNAYYGMEEGGYKVQLLAGGSPDDNEGEITEGVVLAEDPGNLTIPFDTFATSTVVYTFDPAHADFVGQNLQIRLLIPVPTGGAGEVGVDFDDVKLEFESAFIPSPADDAYIGPADELELSWTNMDPNKPGDPVYVDVWFGTDPNELPPPSPTYDFNKIVDATTPAGEDANSVTVDGSTLGTYYWQVNTYIYGSATGDPIKGIVWRFDVVTDAPVTADAGDDMITWSGEAVQLAPTVVDDGASDLTYAWSADPSAGVVFDPNEFVEDPTVTITKVTDNPSVVTLTIEVSDATGPDEDTMTIDLYDNACLAAIGEGQEYDPGDFDADCDTDLEDYAALAEEWLVYKELTTSIVKP